MIIQVKILLLFKLFIIKDGEDDEGMEIE